MFDDVRGEEGRQEGAVLEPLDEEPPSPLCAGRVATCCPLIIPKDMINSHGCTFL
jgi:hypothetical protein